MEYFKILRDNVIIGATSSNQFMKYAAASNCFVRCVKERAQYIAYQNKLYRDSWMAPLSLDIDYIDAKIVTITKEEYDILIAALITEDEIVIEEPEEPVIIPDEEEDNPTLDFVRSSKIKEMSYTCNKTIENGFDIEMGDGTHHFSLTSQDQLNLINISSMIAQGVKQFAYHADNELSTFYSAEEMTVIINEANAWKTYQLAYFNALKAYINSLETIEEIGAITYGVEIPEEFKTEVLKVLEY